MVQIYSAIGDSDILLEVGELTYRIERLLGVLQDEIGPKAELKVHPVIQQAAANLEGWVVTSFELACLMAKDALDSHEKEHVAMLLRYMIHICDRLEAAVFDDLASP